MKIEDSPQMLSQGERDGITVDIWDKKVTFHADEPGDMYHLCRFKTLAAEFIESLGVPS